MARALDADRRGHGSVGRDEVKARPVWRELVDRGRVQLARQEQVNQRDREHPPQLLEVGARVARGLAQERGEPADAVERRPLGGGQRGFDCPRRGFRDPLKLLDAGIVGLAGACAVVEVDEAEEPVARHQRQADGRLHLVAADEGAVDLGGGVPRDQSLPRHRQPDGGSVVVHAQHLGGLALGGVARVAGQLLAHVGQRVEQALLRLADGEGRKVPAGSLLVKEDGDDVRLRRLLHVRDDAAKHRGQAGGSLEGWTHPPAS